MTRHCPKCPDRWPGRLHRGTESEPLCYGVPDEAQSSTTRHVLACNYQEGPIGAEGCICVLVNKNELEALRQRAEAVEAERDRLASRNAKLERVANAARGLVTHGSDMTRGTHAQILYKALAALDAEP